jgi:hypothetical protein
MKWRAIAALVLLIIVLIIFISPVIASPKTALRAQQLAAVFFYLIGALGTALLVLISPPILVEVHEVCDHPLFPTDPLTKSCLLRL